MTSVGLGDRLAHLAGAVRRLSGSQLKVAVVLLAHAGGGGRCWPSVSTIATQAKLSRRAVERALAVLEGDIIASEPRKRGCVTRRRICPKSVPGEMKSTGLETGRSPSESGEKSDPTTGAETGRTDQLPVVRSQTTGLQTGQTHQEHTNPVSTVPVRRTGSATISPDRRWGDRPAIQIPESRPAACVASSPPGPGAPPIDQGGPAPRIIPGDPPDPATLPNPWRGSGGLLANVRDVGRGVDRLRRQGVVASDGALRSILARFQVHGGTLDDLESLCVEAAANGRRPAGLVMHWLAELGRWRSIVDEVRVRANRSEAKARRLAEHPDLVRDRVTVVGVGEVLADLGLARRVR